MISLVTLTLSVSPPAALIGSTNALVSHSLPTTGLDPVTQKVLNSTLAGNNTALTESLSKNSKDFETQEITKFQNEADVLKKEISAATFTPGYGLVKDLINKVRFFSGEVSAIGGGTWSILHSVEDALISKIKQSGPSAFDANEQSYIAGWVDRAMQNRREHPDVGSQLFNNPGFSLNQGQGESTSTPSMPSMLPSQEQQPSIIRTGCPDGYHTSSSGTCDHN